MTIDHKTTIVMQLWVYDLLVSLQPSFLYAIWKKTTLKEEIELRELYKSNINTYIRITEERIVKAFESEKD